MGVEFGFYPLAFDETIGDLRFSTLPDLDEAVNNVKAHECVEKTWIYAPRRRTRDFISGKITESPYSQRVFGLPKTHRVEMLKNEDAARGDFVVQCFGFLVGMRMTTTEAGFLDATPIEPHELNDFIVSGPDLCAAIAAADELWLRSAAERRVTQCLTAAIHALFIGQHPQLLPFEEFIHLYTAFEACHTVRCAQRGKDPTKVVRHNKRIARLCKGLGIPVPHWAHRKRGKIARYRNEAIHEGLFIGEPLGFRIMPAPGKGIPSLLEMRKLLCRIIVALLGIKTDYVGTRIDDRQSHKFSVTRS